MRLPHKLSPPLASLLSAVLIGLCTHAPWAQTACEGRNALTAQASGGFAVAPGHALAIRHTVATRYLSTGAALFLPFAPISGAGQAEVRIWHHDPQTTYPAAVAATATLPPFGGAGWSQVQWDRPLVLDPTLLYWIGLSVPTQGGATFVGYEDAPAGPDPTTHALHRGIGWEDGLIPFRFKYQLLSSDCSDGPSAGAIGVGVACGATGFSVDLQANSPPEIANPLFAVEATGLFPGSTASLYWSLGAAQNPPFALASGCETPLDLLQLLDLSSLGLNPLAQTPVNAMGEARFPIDMPSDPGLRGMMITLQVHAPDPRGFVGLGPPFVLSPGLELTLGY